MITLQQSQSKMLCFANSGGKGSSEQKEGRRRQEEAGAAGKEGCRGKGMSSQHDVIEMFDLIIIL